MGPAQVDNEHIEMLIALQVVAALSSTMAIIVTLTFGVRSFHFFGNVRKVVQNKLCILSFITMIECCTLLVCSCYVYGFDQTDNYSTHFKAEDVWINVGFVTMLSFFYFTLLLRVYITFKNYPRYSLSNNTLFCIGISILLIACIVYVCWIFALEGSINFLSDYDWYLLIATCGGVTVIILSISILYLFLKRFYQMILDMDESFLHMVQETHDYGTNSNTIYILNEQKLRNQHQQMEIVDLMAKITLLTVIEQLLFAVSIILAGVTGFLRLKCGYSSTANVVKILNMLHICGVLLQACFVCFVLHFTFVYNHNQYQRCCKGFHKQFKKCCIWCVVKKR